MHALCLFAPFKRLMRLIVCLIFGLISLDEHPFPPPKPPKAEIKKHDITE